MLKMRRKTTGKLIKWIICFSTLSIRVFFRQNNYNIPLHRTGLPEGFSRDKILLIDQMSKNDLNCMKNLKNLNIEKSVLGPQDTPRGITPMWHKN